MAHKEDLFEFAYPMDPEAKRDKEVRACIQIVTNIKGQIGNVKRLPESETRDDVVEALEEVVDLLNAFILDEVEVDEEEVTGEDENEEEEEEENED